MTPRGLQAPRAVQCRTGWSGIGFIRSWNVPVLDLQSCRVPAAAGRGHAFLFVHDLAERPSWGSTGFAIMPGQTAPGDSTDANIFATSKP